MFVKRGFWHLVCALTVAAVVAAGCGDDASTTSPTSTGAPDGTARPADEKCTPEHAGGSLTMGLYAEGPGLDPIAGSGLSSGRAGGTEGVAFYDALVRFDDKTLQWQPQLAESLTPNSNYTEWVLKLRPNVKFGNGDPLNAAAVKASIERHTLPKSKSTAKRGLALVKDIAVRDDLTLVFSLSQPWGAFPLILATGAGLIANTKVIEERGDSFGLNATGAGAGPYELVKYKPGEEMVLRAKDDYWGGPVCIKELHFRVMGGSAPTYLGLTVGDVQMAFLQDAAVIDQAKKAGYAGLQWILEGGSELLMNNGARGSPPPTTDLRVRRAIAMALDPKVMNQRQFDGKGLPTTALTSPDSVLKSGVAGPPTNVDEAKRLVQEAKAGGWNGTIRLICNDTPDRQQAAIGIETLLGGVGIKVDKSIVDTQRLIGAVISDVNYDLACWGINFTTADAWFSSAPSRATAPPTTRATRTPRWMPRSPDCAGRARSTSSAPRWARSSRFGTTPHRARCGVRSRPTSPTGRRSTGSSPPRARS
jgi:peptide/nickel transport system substrate-binding protein